MRWVKYNANPRGNRTIDCIVRAVALATGKSWDEAYTEIAAMGLAMKDMSNVNAVWGAVLRRNGFRRGVVPDTCPDCYTVEDFARDHNRGVFVLPLDGHVVTVVDGFYYDTFDSGDELPLFYYYKEG